MKTLKLFILFLISSTAGFSCGYYPYGEDIRFSLLEPNVVMKGQMNWFYYSNNEYYYNDYDFDINGIDQHRENIQSWNGYFGNRFTEQEIYEALLIATKADLSSKTCNNSFIQTLNQPENVAFLNYLLFAKQLAKYNQVINDEWERVPKSFNKKRYGYIKKATTLAASETHPELKKRYAYLALRMAYYANDYQLVQHIYSDYFSLIKFESKVDYWALHFNVLADDFSERNSTLMAMVFLNSSEKRFAAGRYLQYHMYNIKDVEQAGKNTEEKIALYFAKAVLQDQRAAASIEAIQQLDPKHPCLEFLALRELNKLEDWVLTYYYTYFNSGNNFWYMVNVEDANDQRMKEDRAYALQLAATLQTCAKTSSSKWMKTFELYARFIGKEHSDLVNELVMEEKRVDSPEIQSFLRQLQVLTLLSLDKDPTLTNVLIQKELKQAVDQHQSLYLLAIARELEYRKHFVLATGVFSKIGQPSGEYLVWKTQDMHRTLGIDFYSDYFYYIDAAYDVTVVEEVLKESTKTYIQPDFKMWLFADVRKDVMRLHDLIGTKYVRNDDWKAALTAFNQVNDTLWNSEYYAYKTYLSEDPFSNDFYDPYSDKHMEEVETRYTKPQLAREILRLQEVVATENGMKKARAAYRLGNCYRNMSYFGNAWLMRRYYWTTNTTPTGLSDDQEYFSLKQAHKYYEMAYESATSRKFKVLALRMVGYCEQLDLMQEADMVGDYYCGEYYLARVNPVYRQLKKLYPDDYDKVVFSCDYLPEYYEGKD